MSSKKIPSEDQRLWSHIAQTLDEVWGTLLWTPDESPDTAPKAPLISSYSDLKLPTPPSKKNTPSHRPTYHPSRKQLRQTKVEATLDLHGFTQEMAFHALTAFIERSYMRGFKCLLVITGKGRKGSGESKGILQKSVPLWLETSSVRPLIRGITQSLQKDGGAGALYVYLKSNPHETP